MLRIGIIGQGRIGQVHAKSASQLLDIDLVAVADPFLNEEQIEFAKKCGAKNFYKDYKDILSNEDIEAVIICTPTDTHADISLEALSANKHVLCEKPIDIDVPKIKEVINKVNETGLKYQVGFNRRFDHNFGAVKTAIKAGELGDVHSFKITSRDPEIAPYEYLIHSGGIFMDMTIHDFDMACFMADSMVEEVYVMGDAKINPDLKNINDIDTAMIMLKFKNGVMGFIDNSRQAAYGYDQRIEVFGEKGALETKNDSESTMVKSNLYGVIQEKPLYFFLERYEQSFKTELECFADSIEKDKPTIVNEVDGLNAVLIAQAAKKSYETGLPVKIEEE